MWIFTRDSYFSLSQPGNAPDLLMIRSRARIDLQRLVDGYLAPDKTIVATPDCDYPHRLLLSRREAQMVFSSIVGEIDYPNFKAEASRSDDAEALVRSEVYGAIWQELITLEQLDELTVVDSSEGSGVRR